MVGTVVHILVLCLLTAPCRSLTDASRATNLRRKAAHDNFSKAIQEIEDELKQQDNEFDLHQKLLQMATPVEDVDNAVPDFLKQRRLSGDDDDYYAANDDASSAAGYSDNDDYTVYYSKSGLDMSKYALKYAGCQNVKTYSDQTDSSFQTFRFVVLRLCPATTCSAYNRLGCSSDFGEYTMPVADYLSTMQEYHLKQLNRYCNICSACTTYEVETDDSTGDDSQEDDATTAVDDGYYFTDEYLQSQYTSYEDTMYGDDEYNDDAYNRKLYYNNNYNGNGYNNGYNNNNGYGYNTNYGYNGNGYNNNNNGYNNGGYNGYNNNNYGYYNDNNNYGYQTYTSGSTMTDDDYYDDDVSSYSTITVPWYIDGDGECMYKTVCDNFAAVCDDIVIPSTDYFACVAYNDGYTAPHCASDGASLEMGIFEDETCSTFTGEATDEIDLDLTPFTENSCISCNAVSAFALVADEDVDVASTNPLCAALYDGSAKCNKNLPENYQYRSNDSEESTQLSSAQYESQNQQDNEDKVCAYIESLAFNNYDEYGEIFIQPDFAFSNWRKTSEYANMAKKANAGQLFMLFLSISVSAGLGMYAMYLHKKLMYRKPWVPPVSMTATSYDSRSEAGRISRQNSNIVAMRSKSHEGSVYKPYGGAIPHRSGGVASHSTEASEGTFKTSDSPVNIGNAVSNDVARLQN